MSNNLHAVLSVLWRSSAIRSHMSDVWVKHAIAPYYRCVFLACFLFVLRLHLQRANSILTYAWHEDITTARTCGCWIWIGRGRPVTLIAERMIALVGPSILCIFLSIDKICRSRDGACDDIICLILEIKSTAIKWILLYGMYRRMWLMRCRDAPSVRLKRRFVFPNCFCNGNVFIFIYFSSAAERERETRSIKCANASGSIGASIRLHLLVSFSDRRASLARGSRRSQ